MKENSSLNKKKLKGEENSGFTIKLESLAVVDDKTIGHIALLNASSCKSDDFSSAAKLQCHFYNT